MKGITRDCLVELLDRKVIYIYAVLTGIAVLVALLSSRMAFEFHMSGNIDTESIEELLRNPLTRMLNTFLKVLVFVTVMASAGLVPNMLVKGRADFYLSKPIARSSLLWNKFFGIWLVYGAVLILSGVIAYASMVVVHGFFDWKILYLFILNLISLFIWLSITMTAGIVSGSTSMSIMAAFLTWLAQFVLHLHDQIKALIDSQPAGYFIDALYYLVPKTGEIGDLTVAAAIGKPVVSWMPLYSSLIFALVLLYLAIAVFRRKDY